MEPQRPVLLPLVHLFSFLIGEISCIPSCPRTPYVARLTLNQKSNLPLGLQVVFHHHTLQVSHLVEGSTACQSHPTSLQPRNSYRRRC